MLLLAGCNPPPAPLRVELLVFGSPATLEIRGVPPERAQAAATSVAAHLAALHRDWHPWEDSALTALNRALAAGRAAPALPSIVELARRSQHFHRLSDGLYDPAVGALVRLWGFHTSDYPVQSPPPTPAQLQAWRDDPPTLADLAVLPADRLRSAHPALQLDFGAIAEGVAAEQSAQLLRADGIADALLTLGGDVLALGSAGGRPWRVGIRDPRGGVLGGVALSDGEALFSSGNYHKFRSAADGGRWPHLLDPRSGRPATGVSAVSVLHEDPVLADVAATALFVGGAARFQALAARMGVGCALLLTDQDQLLLTAPMQQRLALQRTPARITVVPAAGEARCSRK